MRMQTTPDVVAPEKLKRRQMDNSELRITLRPTRDILRSLGQRKREGQILVGFALETNDLVANATAKLIEKNCDMIVANPANEAGVGFMSESNRIVLVRPQGATALPVLSKRECAGAIFDAVDAIAGGAVGNAVNEMRWHEQ